MEETNIRTNSMKAWLLAARPKTLSGAAVPVMIGLALAYCDARFYEEGVFNWTAAVLCLLFAFAMQIDANFINDFYDYVNGADDVETRLGPRRACAQGWVKLDSMKKAIALTTCAACVIGLPLAYYGGMEMIAVGVACKCAWDYIVERMSYLLSSIRLSFPIRDWATCWYWCSSAWCLCVVPIMCSYTPSAGRCSWHRWPVAW